jgi:hypothetical protein
MSYAWTWNAPWLALYITKYLLIVVAVCDFDNCILELVEEFGVFYEPSSMQSHGQLPAETVTFVAAKMPLR